MVKELNASGLIGFCVFVFLSSSPVHADNGDYLTATSQLLNAAMSGSSATAPAKNEISGRCEIEGRGDVGMSAPCNGVEIVLLKSGVEVNRTRADGNGEFRFSRLTAGIYDVNVESPKFKLAHPIQKLSTGHAYFVKLK